MRTKRTGRSKNVVAIYAVTRPPLLWLALILSPGPAESEVVISERTMPGGSCPVAEAAVLAFEDQTFDNADWVSEVILDTTAPDNIWVLDFALQEDKQQYPHYPESGNPPPSRFIRYTYQGPANLSATIEVATWYTKSIIPPVEGITYIQFQYDTWRRINRIGPMIVQDGTYYRGPSVILTRIPEWETYSSANLKPADFTRQTGPGPNQPDFTKPMIVGYSLSSTTNRSFESYDHFIDNFQVCTDKDVVVGDPVDVENRAPFARDDYMVARWDGTEAVFSGLIDPLQNDTDPDGDAISLTVLGAPTDGYSSLEGSLTRYLSFTNPSPFVGQDHFTYTVSDGTLTGDAQVHVMYDPLDRALEGSGSYAAVLSLLKRFRDDVMQFTVDGTRYLDFYYTTATEILKILIFDRPDLRPRALGMVELLRPVLESALDGDGSVQITQAQMDSVAAFMGALSDAGSEELQTLIAEELARLGSLDDYVDLPVGDVLDMILGEPIDTAIDRDDPVMITDFELDQNFPNPFGTSTRISYTLLHPTTVFLSVFDIQGRELVSLVNESQIEGLHTVTWDGHDGRGRTVSSGVYLLRLRTPAHDATKSMIFKK